MQSQPRRPPLRAPPPPPASTRLHPPAPRQDRSSEAWDDELIHEAALGADGIRPAGGKPTINKHWSKRSVRLCHHPPCRRLAAALPPRTRARARAAAAAAHPTRRLGYARWLTRGGPARRQITNPNLQATAFSVVFSAPSHVVDDASPPDFATADRPAAGKGQVGRAAEPPCTALLRTLAAPEASSAACTSHGRSCSPRLLLPRQRWNRDNDPHSIELWRHKGRAQFSEALAPTGMVVGEGGATAMEPALRAQPPPRSPPRAAWRSPPDLGAGGGGGAPSPDGKSEERKLRSISFLDSALQRKGAKTPTAAAATSAGADVAAMGSRARAAIFGHPSSPPQPGAPPPPKSPMRRRLPEPKRSNPSRHEGDYSSCPPSPNPQGAASVLVADPRPDAHPPP